MAIIKCKMCGGDLVIEQGNTVAECEYCGTMQTVPNVDDEKKVTLFARANRLRANNEFDKASGIYESIVADFPEEAEAYWGLVLCKYGIEYVDDPATAKKIPTCHRSSFDSVMDDNNFELTLEYADVVARKVYREEAKQIEEIRKGIIEVSSKEEPYDIFICYKETDENGDRTIDSVLAQDIFDALNEKGYRTFFARITLEDKLGQEYEPYIFAALNSAKIMLAVGTDYEYYNAVWVKNEWSRFLKLVATDKSKHLIPCYKNIDAYDMPKEFAKLQAQDLGKVGAMQDLMRGIEKILPKQKAEVVKETVIKETVVSSVSANSPNVDSLIKRAFMFLEDGDWNSADEYCEKVLDINPECAEAYLCKMLCYLKLQKEEMLGYLSRSFVDTKYYDKLMRFADDELKSRINSYLQKVSKIINQNNEKRRELLPISTSIFAGSNHSLGLKSNGTVVAAGNNEYGQCNVYNWTDIVAMAADYSHSLGLKNDGTVVAVGNNEEGQCDVFDWTDIVAISVGTDYSLGLKSNGTVVAAGWNSKGQGDVSNWRDIAAIAAGEDHSLGLKSDGTVVATGDNGYGQCNVSAWKNIVAISAGAYYSLGLKSDGTVVAVGRDNDGQYNVSEWTNIVYISTGNNHSLGLKVDGTVVAAGTNWYGQCDVSDWTDIVAISAGNNYSLGLKSDGTVVAKGTNPNGKCDVSNWKLFNNYKNYEEERKCKHKCEEESKEERLRTLLLKEKREKLKVFENCIASSIKTQRKQHFAISSNGVVVASGVDAFNRHLLDDWKNSNIVSISAGECHVVGLTDDGYAVSSGNNDYGQCDIHGWSDLSEVKAGGWHTVGLRSDGIVVATGYNECGQCNVDTWYNLVKIAVGRNHTVGLKNDGTVVAIGNNADGQCEVDGWEDIVNIYAFNGVTVGLKKSGTVVATGDNGNGKLNVGNWKDIVDIALGFDHTLGLRKDGTVVATGKDNDGTCNVSEWKDIVAISTLNVHSVGLTKDGTVVATGVNDSGQCNVLDWKDVVAISAGSFCTVGVTTRGRILYAGSDNSEYSKIHSWRLFDDFENIKAERKKAVVIRKESDRIVRDRRQQGVCQYCGGAFKGLFTKKCSKCGREKDY